MPLLFKEKSNYTIEKHNYNPKDTFRKWNTKQSSDACIDLNCIILFLLFIFLGGGGGNLKTLGSVTLKHSDKTE